MNSIFLDMIDYDAMNMTRINELLADVNDPARHGLRAVDLLTIRPSEDLAQIATDFEFQLPGAFKYLTRGWGTKEMQASDSLAMLLFESGYTQRLIEIGQADVAARSDEIVAFLRSG